MLMQDKSCINFKLEKKLCFIKKVEIHVQNMDNILTPLFVEDETSDERYQGTRCRNSCECS